MARERDTYTARYSCTNCGAVHQHELLRGEYAPFTVMCPYCSTESANKELVPFDFAEGQGEEETEVEVAHE